MALSTKAKPKPPTYHKKLSGGHHRHSRHYLKSYWPYLPMAAIVLGGLLFSSLWSHRAVLGAFSDFSQQTLLSDTNTQRLSHSESSLTLNPQLELAAQAKAADMNVHNYWSHTSPDGKTPWDFITQAGYSYQTAGENLAYGFNSGDDTVAAWMNSSEHRANILNADYQDVGFGVVHATNFQGHGPATLVVAMYGRIAPAVATVSFKVDNPTAANQAVKGASVNPSEPSMRLVSRIQLLTNGRAAWSLALTSFIAGAALCLFVLRHGFRIRRLVNSGEAFVAHHPYIDITFVLIITIGYILTRSSGIIR